MAKTLRRSATTDEREFRAAKSATRDRRNAARQPELAASDFDVIALGYAAAFAALSV